MTFWTNEKLSKLRTMAAQRHSAKTIGAALGCSRNAVIGKCHRHAIQLVGTNSPERMQLRAARIALHAERVKARKQRLEAKATLLQSQLSYLRKQIDLLEAH